ncbi:MAG: protein-disulfide reductase DsbD family protein [Roseovarius sp.]
MGEGWDMALRVPLPSLARIAALLAAAMLIAVAAPGSLRAQQLPDVVDMRVLPGWRTAEGVHIAALELRLEPGWITYWRNPGEAGIPPQFDWRRSRNLEGVEIVWPAPHVKIESGLRSIGYSDLLILPLRVLPARAGGDVTLKGRVEIGVCRDICVPVDLRVSGTLPGGARRPDPRIVAALASQPESAAEAGVRRVACRMSPIEGGLGLRAEIDLPGAAGYDTAVVEVGNPQIWVAPAVTERQGDRLIAQTRLYHAEGRSFALDRRGIRITVLGPSRAIDIRGCAAG